MNFNLVSNEENNGHEFNVRLSNPVTIPANSQIYMNFAEMTRDSKIRLDDKGTVTLNINKVYPDVLPSDQTTPNNPLILDPGVSTAFTNSFDIPVGTYTFTAFRDLLNDNLTKLIDGTHAAFYTAIADPRIPDDSRDNDVRFGYSLGQDYGNNSAPNASTVSVTDQGLSATNFFQSTQAVTDTDDPSGLRVVAYAKATGTATAKGYDNYGLSKNHYFHYAFKSERFDSISIEDPTQNFIFAQTILPVHAMTGAVTIGLYSPEYALMSGGANRTGGSAEPRNIPIAGTTSSKLACFCGVEFLESTRTGPGAASLMRVNWATSTIDGVQKTIRDWPNINQTISGMKSDNVGNAANIFGAANQPIIAMQTYLDEDDDVYETDPRLYLRIFRVGNVGDGANGHPFFDEIYDSKLTGQFIPKSFFEAEAAFYDDANKVNSQIPFSVIMGAQVAEEGFELVQYCELDKSANSSADGKPATIIDNYSLSFNTPLSKIFLQTATDPLFPNHTFRRDDLLYQRDFSLEWRRKNYTIFLENLPIQNYKNVSEKRQPAYQKAILANIPAPFGIASQLVEPGQDEQELVTVYQPYNSIITDLKNNEIVVNNFGIRIVDMSDETTAKEITESVINFTIKSQ